MSNVPTAKTSIYPATCPECSAKPVTLVSVGDPDQASETSTAEAGNATITVMTHFQFLSCERCKHSWHLDSAQA